MLDDRQNNELTVVSFSSETPPQPDRRDAPRSLSVLRTAVLHTSFGQELCLVRNISIGGLMAHIFCDLEIDHPVTVEFKSEHSVRGRVVWRRDDLAGIQFFQPVELTSILSNQFQGTFLPLEARAPRVEVGVPARIRSGAKWQPVLLKNISQGGARLELSDDYTIGSTVHLAAPGLAVLSGSVRWRHGGSIGMAFDKPLPFADVAHWVADSHRALIDGGSIAADPVRSQPPAVIPAAILAPESPMNSNTA